MYEDGVDGWAVAVIVDSPQQTYIIDEIQHGCIVLAGDDVHFDRIGPTSWHEYLPDDWDARRDFTRLA